MKQVKILMLSLTTMMLTAMAANAQEQTEITKKNSWLKLGGNVGVPVGNASNYSNLTAGIELKGQLMETNQVGIGLTTGYNHYFAKDGGNSFGAIPLGAFLRFYPMSKGFFAGVDGGYSVLTGKGSPTGGAYVRPQLGYHNYDWNVFGFYNNIFRSDVKGGGIGSVGIGATYNIRFN